MLETLAFLVWQVHFMGPGECKVELSCKEDAPLKRVDESYEPGLRCERRPDWLDVDYYTYTSFGKI